MKCPKTASELLNEVIVKEKELYQARLDKVLTRFKDVGDNSFIYKYNYYGNKCFLAYQNKSFKLGYNIDKDNILLFKTIIPVLQLDTVELLLRDLGVELDE
jgi:hypothetical protein